MNQLFSNKKAEKEFLSLLLDGQSPPLMLTQKQSKNYIAKEKQSSDKRFIEPIIRKVYRKTDNYALGDGRIKIDKEEVKEKLSSKKGLKIEERRGLWNKRDFIDRGATQAKEFAFQAQKKKDQHDMEYDKGKLKKVKQKRIKKYKSFGEVIQEKNE